MKVIFAEVLHQSKPLPGSPYTCKAYDTSKVTSTNVPKGQLALHNPVSFTCRLKLLGVMVV